MTKSDSRLRMQNQLEQDAPPVVRVFVIDSHARQVAAVGEPGNLGVGIVDAIFRLAGRTGKYY
jgi:hypothetical protein